MLWISNFSAFCVQTLKWTAQMVVCFNVDNVIGCKHVFLNEIVADLLSVGSNVGKQTAILSMKKSWCSWWGHAISWLANLWMHWLCLRKLNGSFILNMSDFMHLDVRWPIGCGQGVLEFDVKNDVIVSEITKRCVMHAWVALTQQNKGK